MRGVSESKGVVELTQGEGYDNRTGGRLMKRGKGADWRARRAWRGRDLDWLDLVAGNRVSGYEGRWSAETDWGIAEERRFGR